MAKPKAKRLPNGMIVNAQSGAEVPPDRLSEYDIEGEQSEKSTEQLKRELGGQSKTKIKTTGEMSDEELEAASKAATGLAKAGYEAEKRKRAAKKSSDVGSETPLRRAAKNLKGHMGDEADADED